MNNNYILSTLCKIFNFDDEKLIAVFDLLAYQVTADRITKWFKKYNDPDFLLCSDIELSIFLNALICEKRGKKEGPPPEPDKKMTNNVIFKKLKIAMDMQSENVLETLELGGTKISSYELTAIFRKPNHKNYRFCKKQVLQSFLKGLQEKQESL